MRGVKRLLAGVVALCLGLLMLFMYIGAVWLLSLSSLLDLRQSYALADRLRQTEPAAWVALPSEDYAGTVLLQGRPSRYLSESSSLGPNGAYGADQISKPDFDLQGATGSVRVTNGCFRRFDGMFGNIKNIRYTMDLGDSCYQLSDGRSSAAHDNFTPEDLVWVIGRWDAGSLRADAVFNSSPDQYASSLESWTWLLLLPTALGIGVLASGIFCIVMRCAGRPQIGWRVDNAHARCTTPGRSRPRLFSSSLARRRFASRSVDSYSGACTNLDRLRRHKLGSPPGS